MIFVTSDDEGGCGIIIAIVNARASGFFATTLLLAGNWQAWAQDPANEGPPPPFELEWMAPANCPDRDQIRTEILRLASPAPPSHHLKAQAVIRSDDHEGWTLALTTELDGITGERHLSGSSCQSLGEAAALTLALILNPQAKIETPPPAPPPALEPSEPSLPSPRPWPPLVWQMGAVVGLQMGVLDHLPPWFGLSLGATMGRFSLRALPGFTPARDVSSHDRSDSGGRLWLASAAVMGCYALADARIALAPCLGANVARLHGQGWGVREPRQASVYWTSAELALRMALALGHRVSLELWGFGLVPLYKSSLYLDEAGLISRPSTFAFGALAGFSLALP